MLTIIARNRKIKSLKYICLFFIGFAFIMGCSGNYGTLKRQTRNESKDTIAEYLKLRLICD